jgi:hypothetical protein
VLRQDRERASGAGARRPRQRGGLIGPPSRTPRDYQSPRRPFLCATTSNAISRSQRTAPNSALAGQCGSLGPRPRPNRFGQRAAACPTALPHCCSDVSAITSRRVISRPLLVQGSSPADGRSHELRTSPALLLLSGRRSLSSLADSRASESPPTAGARMGPANGRPFERSKQQSRRRRRSVPPLRNLSTLTRRTQTSAFTKTQHSRWLRSPVVTLLLPVGSGSEKPLGVGRALLSFNEERWRRRGQSLGLRGKRARRPRALHIRVRRGRC